jgi:hypothetical protein
MRDDNFAGRAKGAHQKVVVVAFEQIVGTEKRNVGLLLAKVARDSSIFRHVGLNGPNCIGV